MLLKGLLFLAGFTARSKAYAQAMAYKHLEPEKTILFGPEQPLLPGQTDQIQNRKSLPGLFSPDLSISLTETCRQNNRSYIRLKCEDVNDSLILVAIEKLSPKLILYSGYGTQLVRKELLGLGIPFLHIHSGWLPEYKGSTTLYYSWLNEKKCGASAIYLTQGIDEGPIIARKKYPAPPPDIDPDYIYDCAIRADLLMDVLGKYEKDKNPPKAKKQSGTGNTYYVIHPVLKHLARLSAK